MKKHILMITGDIDYRYTCIEDELGLLSDITSEVWNDDAKTWFDTCETVHEKSLIIEEAVNNDNTIVEDI